MKAIHQLMNNEVSTVCLLKSWEYQPHCKVELYETMCKSKTRLIKMSATPHHERERLKDSHVRSCEITTLGVLMIYYME